MSIRLYHFPGENVGVHVRTKRRMVRDQSGRFKGLKRAISLDLGTVTLTAII